MITTKSRTLEFIVKPSTLPFGMVRDIIECFQNEPHEFPNIKKVVGKLRMVPKGGMVTLRKVSEESVNREWMCKSHRETWECVL